MPKQAQQPSTFDRITKTLGTIVAFGFTCVKFFVLLFVTLILLTAFTSFLPPELEQGNIAVIPIEGVITSDGEAGTFTGGLDSRDVVEQIEKADKNDEIKAILFEVNSPGGSPVATDEISQAIKATNKTTVAVIREIGASGAYWLSTATDRIFANRMSITGSIGVTASRLEFGGLLSDYNVTYRRLIAGKYKDAGTIYRDMTPEEQQLYQQILDNLHTEFIKTVAENRHLNEGKVRELATGFVYLGSQAKELGLVDELGGKKEAIAYLEKQLNITAEPVEYKQTGTFLDDLGLIAKEGFYSMGRGLGSSVSTETKVSLT